MNDGLSRHAALPWIALVTFGVVWGMMQPISKIAVNGGFEPFGMMVWQGAISLGLAGALAARKGLPKGRAQWQFCGQVAVLGNLIPHFATFTAVSHLPAGLMAIILALVPILALTIAGLIGREALTPRRVGGVTLGLLAMAIIILTRTQTETSGADWPVWAVGVAALAPLCYAINSTLTAARGMAGMHPLQAFAGASAIFLPVSIIMALITGQLRGLSFDIPSFSVVAVSTSHTLVYAGYLWLLGRSGAVFASQTAYLVTGFGVIWSMVLLGERYSSWVWAALVLMLIGLTLVRPSQTSLAHTDPSRDTA
ncbi:DMT family transporter [Octadecabacter sp. G9-8]|uniref:DMT family transporter n=1 Tax=Octadecabacter dasysiphoniae TaxID=2909341 RepID=A0ABS9CRZ5_9RHOB|nr:DMT family transporter [Octadecabacter dasysiphoniae]MCF2870006.1 DMT family transporter [Octadecabacter dasysiphoniae]